MAELSGAPKYKGLLITSADSIHETCYYGLYNRHTDCPVLYGILLVFHGNVTNQPVSQIALNPSGQIYVRGYYGGTWQGWVEL